MVHPVEGLSFAERARLRNREIGFIFQSFNLIGDLSVPKTSSFPLTYRGDVSTAERKRRTAEALDRVGMSHRGRHLPNQLSGGQQQRVAVARALAGSPSVLLADEPTGNLDSRNGEAVMGLLSELHAGGATIRHGDARRPLCPSRGPDRTSFRRPRGGRSERRGRCARGVELREGVRLFNQGCAP